jgi:hypothetical protein
VEQAVRIINTTTALRPLWLNRKHYETELPVRSKNAGSMLTMEFNRQDINTIMQSKTNEYWRVKHLKKVLLVSTSPLCDRLHFALFITCC